jgi:hypothetical protein
VTPPSGHGAGHGAVVDEAGNAPLCNRRKRHLAGVDDDDDTEGDDTPLAKCRKMNHDPDPLNLVHGREPGDQVHHSEYGQCTLIARAVAGWNVRYESQDALDQQEWYADDVDLV